MTSLIHLPPDAAPEAVTACLAEHGYAIIDRLAPAETMDRMAAEIAPYVEATPFPDSELLGFQTRRTGSLVHRSPAARELVMNPTILGAVGLWLRHATSFQLHLTQVISVYPGSAAQQIHQDELAWDLFPFPDDYEVQCNTLWALTDYTEAMGATRVVPGSQRAGKLGTFAQEDSLPAEMERGSVLVYTGKVYHGAGANVTDRVRQAINITYAVGWVRQEENQFLSCPPEVARTLPEDLRKLMGYQCGCFSLGYFRDYEDPMNALFEPETREVTPMSTMRADKREALGV